MSSTAMKTYTIPITEDPITKDLVIEFPDSLMEQVGWKAGDTVKWEIREDGTCYLFKVSTTESTK